MTELANSPKAERANSPQHVADAPPSLAAIRESLDAIDGELVRLMAARGKLVRAAAAFKGDERTGRDVRRVEEVIARVRAQAARAGLEPDVAEAVWRTMTERSVGWEIRTSREREPATERTIRHQHRAK